MSQERKIIVRVRAETEEEFKELAGAAKEMGATHVNVDCLPRSRWMLERDLSDPYPNWSMIHTPLFKLVCPSALEKYLPVGFIRTCFETVKERCEFLASLGLKGALFSNEPFWLPEEAYRDHPDWRGARCDHPRRSRHTYYSPCIDNPEILEMYRLAVKELLSQTGIDFISFMTNDSGGGLCWSSGTYVGPNGPEACRNRSMSERVLGFLDALNAGADEAGVPVTINFSAGLGFKAAEAGVDEAWRGAADNCIIGGRNNRGERPIAMLTGEENYWIKKIPDLYGRLQSVGRAMKSDKEIVVFNLGITDFHEEIRYFVKNLQDMPKTSKGYADTVFDTAADIAGSEGAHLLNDALFYIHEGELHFSHSGIGLIAHGIVHQRWINRPFVLFPEELTEEESSYYRPYQFQALDEKHANDLLDMQNIECTRGFSAAFLLSQTVAKASGAFHKAVVCLNGLSAVRPDLKDKADMLIRRLDVYDCLMKTCVNAALFQDLVDRIDFETRPVLDCRWPTRNDLRIEEFQNITRSEIDNAYRLADLLEGHAPEIFRMTDDPGLEDVFTLGPDLVSQIRRKAEIMLDHELDANRVFERHNI